MECDVESLLESAACFVGIGPIDQAAIQVFLLCEWANT